MYIYIYIEREREIYIYIYAQASMFVCMTVQVIDTVLELKDARFQGGRYVYT